VEISENAPKNPFSFSSVFSPERPDIFFTRLCHSLVSAIFNANLHTVPNGGMGFTKSARHIPPSLYLWHFEEFVSLSLSSLIKTDSFDSSNVRLRRRQD
jgi:hypothetical protein